MYNDFFRFKWKRTGFLKGSSKVDIQWTVPDNTTPGTYRIQHFGHYKYILGGIFPYTGTTGTFTVSAN